MREDIIWYNNLSESTKEMICFKLSYDFYEVRTEEEIVKIRGSVHLITSIVIYESSIDVLGSIGNNLFPNLNSLDIIIDNGNIDISNFRNTRIKKITIAGDIEVFTDCAIPSIEELVISSDKLVSIENFPNLKKLDITDMSLEVLNLSFLEKTVKLETLHITILQSIEDFSPIEHAKNLKELRISTFNNFKPSMSFKDISFLKVLSSLEILELPYDNYDDLSSIGALRKLDILLLRGYGSYINFDFLKNLNNLKELYLGDCLFSSKSFDLSVITFLYNLEKLDVHGDLRTKKIGLWKNIGALHKLKELRLTDIFYDELSEIDLKYIESLYIRKLGERSKFNYVTNLLSFELVDSRHIKDIEFIRKFKNLRILKLRDLNKLEDLSPIENLNNLELLGLFGLGFIHKMTFLSKMIKMKELELPHMYRRVPDDYKELYEGNEIFELAVKIDYIPKDGGYYYFNYGDIV